MVLNFFFDDFLNKKSIACWMIDAFLLVGFETRGFTDALAPTHDSPS